VIFLTNVLTEAEVNNKNTTVFIYNHLIYLNENQRYDLFACIPVEAIGILIKAKLDKSDLRAQEIQEIFVNYTIDCNIHSDAIFYDGKTMHIHLPPPDEISNSKIPFQPADLESYDLYDLLNKSEGGREELFYETFTYDVPKKIKSFHKIEIKDEKFFEDSMDFVHLARS
jgi:hypothetical protein